MIYHRIAIDDISEGTTTTWCNKTFTFDESDKNCSNEKCNCPECLKELGIVKPTIELECGCYEKKTGS
jgi:hypothetical protein